MNRIGWFVLLPLVVCLSQSAYAARKHNGRNTGGANLLIGGKFVTAADEAGWHVAIIYNRTLLCAGTLLRNDVVLTAAECVKDMEPANMLVRAGSRNFKSGGQLRKVRETIYHPDYAAATAHAHNVALLQLLRPFNSTTTLGDVKIRLVELPADGAAAAATLPSSIFVYGWGYSRAKANTTMTKKLRVLKTKVYSARKCAKFLADGARVESAFCTGDSVKRVDICTDDLGSPAMYKRDVQYGIVAASSGCSEDSYTTILTSVLAYKPWIMETLREFQSTQSEPN